MWQKSWQGQWAPHQPAGRQNWRVRKKCLGEEVSLAITNTGQDRREGKLLLVSVQSYHCFYGKLSPMLPVFKSVLENTFPKVYFLPRVSELAQTGKRKCNVAHSCPPVHCGSLACVLQEKKPFGTLLQRMIFGAIR